MINIEPIEAFSDNYIWLLTTNEGSIVFDPGESQNLLKILKENNLNLKAILITHHHFDHTGGINEILSEKSIEKIFPVFFVVFSISLSCSKDVQPGLSNITSFPAFIHSIAKAALLTGMSAINTNSISLFANKSSLFVKRGISGCFSLKSFVKL